MSDMREVDGQHVIAEYYDKSKAKLVCDVLRNLIGPVFTYTPSTYKNREIWQVSGPEKLCTAVRLSFFRDYLEREP